MPYHDLHTKPFDAGTIAKLEIFENYAEAWVPTFVMSGAKEIHIFDFFSGPGYDCSGVPGSPIRLLQKINSFLGYFFQKGTKITLHLNEFEPVKKNQPKFELLQKNAQEFLELNPKLKHFLAVSYHNENAETLFFKLLPLIKKFPSLIYLDQNGVKFISKQYLLELEKLDTTDFLYFVSSSYFKWFGNTEEFKKVLAFDTSELAAEKQSNMHRLVASRLKKELPQGTKLQLLPFSIKKETNVYGIIFGAKHYRAVDKFLAIAWERNSLNGEANFDIDDDIYKSGQDLFGRKGITKIEKFEADLEIGRLYIKKGERLSAMHYLEEGTGVTNAPAYADTQMNMLEEEGRIDEASGETANALSLYKKELGLAKQSNNPEAQAKALANIAGVLMKQDAGSSLVYLKEALGIAQKLPHAQLKVVIYEAMTRAYRQQKNYREAMLVLAEHNKLLDSLLAANTNSEIAALDSSYVIESKEEQLDKLKNINRRERIEIDFGLVILAAVVSVALLLWLYLRKINRLNHKLSKSNQIRDTLFSIIGHDLKGPAGNTVQLFQMIDAGELPFELQKELLGELKIQAIASFDLLNDLFAWGKAQLHGVEVKPELFNLNPVVQKAIGLLRQQAGAKDITVKYDIAAGAQVFADVHHVEFVIRNLFSNAIKFTHEKGLVEIRAAHADGMIVCSVKDNGIGISREKQLAFQKTTLPVSFGTKGEKGSGLGLLLIKEFVIANKGRIWLESEEGRGSTFYFSLPAKP